MTPPMRCGWGPARESLRAARSLIRLEFGQAICGTVALHREPVVATYIQQSDDPMVELVKSFGIRTAEVEFLRMICDYVTVAASNSYLDRLANESVPSNSSPDTSG